MGQKTNHRSFRLSDEVMGVLEAFTGNSLNDKLENLVLHCFWEGKRIDEQISRRKKELADLTQRYEAKRRELIDCDNLLAEKYRLTGAITALALRTLEYKEHVTQIVDQAELPAPAECVTTQDSGNKAG